MLFLFFNLNVLEEKNNPCVIQQSGHPPKDCLTVKTTMNKMTNAKIVPKALIPVLSADVMRHWIMETEHSRETQPIQLKNETLFQQTTLLIQCQAHSNHCRVSIFSCGEILFDNAINEMYPKTQHKRNHPSQQTTGAIGCNFGAKQTTT